MYIVIPWVNQVMPAQILWRCNYFSDTTITTAVPLANTTVTVYETTTPWLTTKQTSYIGMFSRNMKLYDHFKLENDHLAFFLGGGLVAMVFFSEKEFVDEFYRKNKVTL